MKFPSPIKQISAAVLGAFLFAPVVASAADEKKENKDRVAAVDTRADRNASPMAPGNDRMTWSDRERMKTWSNEKEQLEKQLQLGQDKSFYVKALTDKGYRITSVNSDKPDNLEYEVVKGDHSYEVQIDMKDGKATKVDVATNVWRADATKAAMRGTNAKDATTRDATARDATARDATFVAGNEAYSDRSRMKTWNTEKERLQKSLATGHDKNHYAAELKKHGYQVTSVNDREKDYVEYEVVKGSDTFEVQIDFDGGKAKKVDVTTNMWQSDATERALASGKTTARR